MTADSLPLAFGSDRAEAGPDGTLLLECAVGKSWLARQGGSQTRSEHPGTAVDWQDEVYEVIAVEPLAGTAVRYRLAPWEHGHAIRRIERYDEGSERARHAFHKETHADSGKRILALLFSPILGHLPAAVQKKMERDFGAPAAAMTVVSALPFFVLGLVGVISFTTGGLGAEPFAPRWLGNPVVAGYFVVESVIRMASALIHGEPMGSLFGLLGYGVWTLAGGQPAAAPVSRALPASPAERALQDRYTMIEPLLALLSPQEQQQLELRFAFDPFRWGRRTSAIILWVAGANVFISILTFLNRTDVFLDFAALVVGGSFVLEQISRRRRMAAGHPAGSVLGALVRPLARPLLEAARS